jgi:hypothetical protein
MLHPSEFSLTGPYSISTQSVTTGNTTHIARTLLFTVHSTLHRRTKKNQKQPFFPLEGEEINLLFWGNMFKLHPNFSYVLTFEITSKRLGGKETLYWKQRRQSSRYVPL